LKRRNKGIGPKNIFKKSIKASDALCRLGRFFITIENNLFSKCTRLLVTIERETPAL
jgi:hypothetical protein